MKYLAALALLLIVAACHSGEHKIEKRSYLDLSGTWQFALDSANTGISGGWFKTALPDSIPLPGTTDAAGKGFLNRDTTTLHLNRVYRYEGAAWYRRSVTIPESFVNRTIVLKMERTKTSRIWVDSTLVGGSRILQSPQVFDLTALLTPGEHSIAIRIDNRLDLTPYGNVHIYSDETQTNWNGILGEIGLIAMPHTHITRMRVFPDLPGQKVAVEIGLRNPGGLDSLDLELIVADPEGHLLPGQKIRAAADSLIAVDFPMGDGTQLWDEFQQPLYRLTAVL
ncbi:MAG TPA: beta-galactosidase, partial [Calditrichia bacterium]|nr:beta-galactosidase [Calditrichia bacterium]